MKEKGKLQWNFIEQLQLFRATVEELKKTNLMKKGFSSNMSIKFGKDQGLQFETSWPDEDDLRSFLLTFRQFISKKEPVFLNCIYNISIQRVKDEKLKKYLIDARDKWKQLQKMGLIRLVVHGRELTPEEITNIWICGSYFHKDKDKSLILKSLKYHEAMLFKHQLLEYLVEATRHIFYIDKNVEKILEADNGN